MKPMRRWKTVYLHALPVLCLIVAMQVQVQAAELPCELVLSRTELELGRLTAAEVNPQRLSRGKISLGKQMTTLNVVCTKPARFAIAYITDTPKIYHPGASEYAPALNIVLMRAQADGKPAAFASSLDAGLNGERIKLSAGDKAHLQVAGQDVAVSHFTAQAEIDVLLDAAHLKSPVNREIYSRGFFELIPY